MNAIPPHALWVGHAGDGRDLRRIFDAGIRARVELAAEEAPAAPARDLVACRFPLLDGAGNDDSVLALAVETVATLVRRGLPTLVCCGVGMSRSPAVAACALALLGGETPAECLRRVAAHHPADVSPGLWAELQRTWGSLRGP